MAGDARTQSGLYDDAMPETEHADSHDPLEHMLQRSEALHERFNELLDDAEFDGSPRGEAALGMCLVAMEHATALHALMALGMPTSAASLMRLQFEALTRAMWLIYAAPETAIEKLSAPLTLEAEQAAKNLPSAKDMIDQIGKRVGQDTPAAAHQMLVHFKDISWNAMNSFVHGGIHRLRRNADGFPVHLALQVLRNSNGLSTMTAMTMAKRLDYIQGDFLEASTYAAIEDAIRAAPTGNALFYLATSPRPGSDHVLTRAAGLAIIVDHAHDQHDQHDGRDHRPDKNIKRKQKGTHGVLRVRCGRVILTGDEAITKPMSKVQPAFADCLPDLLKP